MIYEEDLKRARDQYKNHRDFLKKLKKTNPKKLDIAFHTLHEEVFEEIDCLACANCCKTTSPIFKNSDIERLSKSLKMKVTEFIEEYLRVDEEDDYVLKTAPCPFLGDDNKCIVYKNRPTACREYPHTNRKNMYQILNLTVRNTLVCPAVSRIVETLKNSEP